MATYRQPLITQWDDATLEDRYYLISGTGENDVPASAGKTEDWANPSRITADDTLYASITTTTSGTYVLPYLRASNFGFTVPTAATIVGVEVAFRYLGVTANGVYTESSLKLAWGSGASTLSATDHAAGGAVNLDALRLFGSSSDMWGESSATLTPAVVNSTDFGVVLKLARASGTTFRAAGVDYFRVAVSYSITEDGSARVTRAYAEAIGAQASTIRVTRAYAEVVRSIDGTTPVTGTKRRPVIVVGG